MPEELLKAILRIAKRCKLNPVFGQIAWELDTTGDYEVYIPIDGWIALIHREPSFQGLTFHQSAETKNNIPMWMECTIYRSDLPHPITVREYFAELKTDHPMWQRMPRRMLRHKTMQQCARLAFRISTQKIYRAENQIHRIRSNTLSQKFNHEVKDLLKEKLRVNKV